MKSKTHKRKLKLISVLCLIAFMVVSYALFTDRAQSNASYNMGTLDIELTESWTSDNTETLENFYPGTKLDFTYSLKNNGNLDAKLRETFVVTTNRVITDEFDIYKASDVTYNDTLEVWETSADPIEVRSIKDWNEGSKITYELPEYVLSASGTKEQNFVLLFNKESDVETRGTAITVEYLAQALQDENTNNATWADAKVVCDKLVIGGEEIDVVPYMQK